MRDMGSIVAKLSDRTEGPLFVARTNVSQLIISCASLQITISVNSNRTVHKSGSGSPESSSIWEKLSCKKKEQPSITAASTKTINVK
uniref:Uncharacterized protein n=1 Tax=Heterorhabditis bacteriophora TaxID=37862 RepID=A0A1I7X469_HETBA